MRAVIIFSAFGLTGFALVLSVIAWASLVRTHVHAWRRRRAIAAVRVPDVPPETTLNSDAEAEPELRRKAG